jgi:Domain of unknown function (DUF1830)
MAQILDPLPNKDDNNAILCCYVNATSQIQIARITNIPNWYFERVVFPGQRLVFEALPSALLEIHTGMMASAILSDTISCKELSVQECDNNNTTEEQLSKEIKPTKEEQSNIISNEKKISNNTLNLTQLAVSC